MIDFKRNKKRGFSLLEVMFATAILTITMGSFLYSLNQTTRMVAKARSQDVALNALRDKLEEISASDLSRVVENYHNRTFHVRDTANNELLISPDQQANPLSVTVNEINGTGNLYDVKISVTWQQGLDNRTLSQEVNTTFAIE